MTTDTDLLCLVVDAIVLCQLVKPDVLTVHLHLLECAPQVVHSLACACHLVGGCCLICHNLDVFYFPIVDFSTFGAHPTNPVGKMYGCYPKTVAKRYTIEKKLVPLQYES